MRYRDYLIPQAEKQTPQTPEEDDNLAFSATEKMDVRIPFDTSDIFMPQAFDVKRGAGAVKKYLQGNFPLVWAHIADNANFRFLIQRLDGGYEHEEGFEVTEKDVEGYEEFPQLLWAVNRAELDEYKRIADDIRYQRAYKETRGFWANFAASFTDPINWMSGWIGGGVTRGVFSIAGTIGRALNLSSQVRPAVAVVSKAVTGGAVTSVVDASLHDMNNTELSRAVQNATTGGLLGGAFAVAPELTMAMARAGKAELFRRKVQAFADAASLQSPQSGVVTNQGSFEQTVGAFTPNVKLANNVNPTVREIGSELSARAFDVYDKQGNIVPQKTPVGAIASAKISERIYKANKNIDVAFNAWTEVNGYGWLAKKFPNWTFLMAPKSAMQKFNEFIFNAKLSADANGKCYTGIKAVDNYLNNQHAPLVYEMTKEAWNAGVYKQQTEAFEKKLRGQIADAEKFVREYEHKTERLENAVFKIERKLQATEDRFSALLGDSEQTMERLRDKTEHQLFNEETRAVKEAEGVAQNIEEASKDYQRQHGLLTSVTAKLNAVTPRKLIEGFFRRKDKTVATVKDLTDLTIINDELGTVQKLIQNSEGENVRLVAGIGYDKLNATERAIADTEILKTKLAALREREQKLLQRRDEIASRLNISAYEIETASRTDMPEVMKKAVMRSSELGKKLGFKEGQFSQLSKMYNAEMKKNMEKLRLAEEELERHKARSGDLELAKKQIEDFNKKIETKDYSIQEVLTSDDSYYLHRMYDYKKIEADPEDFKDCVTAGFKSIYPHLSDKECRKMAEEVYNDMMLPASNKRHLSFEQRGAEIDRRLKFKTIYIADYLVKDAQRETATLVKTLTVDTELAKRGLLDVDNVMLRIQENGERLAQLMKSDEAALMRKHTADGAELVGRVINQLRGISEVNPFFGKKTNIIVNNLTSIAKNYLVAQYLGLSSTARLLDMFTTTLHLGIGNYLRGIYRIGGYDFKKITGLTKDELDPFVHAVDENGGRLLAELGKSIDNEWTVTRWTRNLAAGVSTLARLVDEHGKKTIGYAAEEYILQGCRKIKNSEALSEKHKNFLLHYGIDEGTAKKIATEFEQHGTVQSDTKSVFANTDAWSDTDVADALKSAVRKCQQECIITPTTGATPLFFEHPLIGLALQFKRCTFAAAEKATIPFIQKWKRNEYGTCVSACVIGGAAAYLREEIKDFMSGRDRTQDEKIASALGSLDVFAYGAFLKDNFEKIDFDEKDAFSNVYKVLDYAPFTSFTRNAVQSLGAFKKLYSGVNLNRSDLTALKTTFVPAYTFFGWARALNALQEEIGKDMMIGSYYKKGVEWKEDVGPSSLPYKITGTLAESDVKNLRRAETEAKNKKRDKILGKESKDIVYRGKNGIVVKRREGNRIVGYKIVNSEEELRKTQKSKPPKLKRGGKGIRVKTRKGVYQKERDDDR